MQTKYKWFREAGVGMFVHWGVFPADNHYK